MKFGYRYSIIFFLLLLPFVYAMFFTFPLGDDFGRALYAKGIFDWYGGFHDLGLKWMRWSGRYTHHFLVIFLGDAVMTRAGYGLVCAGVLSLYAIAFFGIFSRIVAGIRGQEKLFFTLIALLTLMSGYGTLNITYYLVTDILGIGIGNAMVLMFIYSLCRLWYLDTIRKKDVAFSVFCSAFAIGCYEHAAIGILAVMLVTIAMSYSSDHLHKNTFLFIAKLTLFFFVVSFLAPGNFKRQRKRDVTLERMLEQLTLFWKDWIAYIPAVFKTHYALIAIVLGALVSVRKGGGNCSVPTRTVFLLGIFSFLFISCALVLVHSLSDVPISSATKIQSSVHLLLGIVLVYIALSFGRYLNVIASKTGPAVISVFLALVFICSDNTKATLWNVFTNELHEFAELMEKRKKVFQEQGNGDIVVASLASCPFPSCLGDPVPTDAEIWPSRDIAKLYGQRSVISASPDVNKAFGAAANGDDAAWVRLPGAQFEVSYAPDIVTGANLTFRDGWLFFRSQSGMMPSDIRVLTVPKRSRGWLPAGLESGQKEKLFSGDAFQLSLAHAFFGRLKTLTLAPVSPLQPEDVLHSPAERASDGTICAARLGLANPEDVAGVFVSVAGDQFIRIPMPSGVATEH